MENKLWKDFLKGIEILHRVAYNKQICGDFCRAKHTDFLPRKEGSQMMNKLKKMAATLAALMLTVGLLPMSASAVTTGVPTGDAGISPWVWVALGSAVVLIVVLVLMSRPKNDKDK